MRNQTLAFAVRPKVILKYLGQLFLIVTGLIMVPYTVSLYFGDLGATCRYGVVMSGFFFTGLLLVRLPEPRRIQINEALSIVALMFVITPAAMAYPMMASGLPYEDALFEAISAGTTTGVTIIANVEDMAPTLLFSRAWMQWYGGLGVVIFALALVIRPGPLTKGLSAAEQSSEDLVGGARAHARYVLITYLIITGAGILLLALAGLDPFTSALYSFAAVSTGGLAPHDSYIAEALGWAPSAIVMSLCIAGSLSFVVYRQTYRQGLGYLVSDLQTRAFFAACLMTCVALGLSMWIVDGQPLNAVVTHAPMLGVSAQTTGGFAVMDMSGLGPSSKLILIVSMAVGGGVGSTAGGFKIMRLLIAIRVISIVLERAGAPPHAFVPPRLGDEKLDSEEIEKSLSLILLFVSIAALSWIPFVALGYDPLDALFEVVAALGNAGLSTGVTGPELPLSLKAILGIDMLLGRLEIIAWLVLVSPRTWIGQRRAI